jgi:hypothetical protein
MSSNLDVGMLILARRELTSSEQGDWEGCVGLCTDFGVIAVLVGFSLAVVAHVVVPIVGHSRGRLTLMKVSDAMMRSKIIFFTPPTARLLAFSCHGYCPIMGVPTCPHRGDVVVVICCDSVSLNLF